MERAIVTILGSVQGVGFRPFVYRLAKQHHLVGGISNTSSGVIIDVQGEEHPLADFQRALLTAKPNGARISDITLVKAPLHECSSFEIKASQSESDTALALLPDSAMCHDCVKELFDPHNRRFYYPFLHCIACGPRFSLFLRMPFDRAHTTMDDFCMCRECKNEYETPADRRFYSQTNCCPQCGPELLLRNSNGEMLASKQEAVHGAVQLLKEGKIVAMKNTGGYQLLVDATNDPAVRRLRLLKKRASKPFALLMPTVVHIHHIAEMCPVAEQVLTSPAAPIVLLKKRDGINAIAPSVSGGSSYEGVMLPHSPLQHLLLNVLKLPLVATSGNISGSPLCITEEEALTQLAPVCDAFLVHNRQIRHRLDDSIVHIIANQPVLIRRARGYTPYAIAIPAPMRHDPSPDLFAAGSHQKNTFAFAKKNQIYISQHIGDLESAETCRAYGQEVEKWENLLGARPTNGIGDKHPAYYTTHYLEKRGIQSAAVQHHQSHVWAGMIDNQIQPPFFSIVWDGTGWGEDGTIWGGEAFLVTREGMQRLASLYPFRLPGGEKAVREPRRPCLGALYAIYGENLLQTSGKELAAMFDQEELQILLNALMKGINSPICSSIGRLFDAVSALLGCCTISHFEGEAALVLEAMAHKAKNDPVHYHIPLLKEKGHWLMDWRPMFLQIAEDKREAVPVPEIALAFHKALAQCIVALAEIAGQKNVLLTGGVMQNKLLAEEAVDKLRQTGFTPYWHHNIPPNDGGLSVGQLIGSFYS